MLGLNNSDDIALGERCDRNGGSLLSLNRMKDHGIPTRTGYYWCSRVGGLHARHGDQQIVQVLQIREGSELFGDGFGEMTLEEIGYEWQPVKPPDAATLETHLKGSDETVQPD